MLSPDASKSYIEDILRSFLAEKQQAAATIHSSYEHLLEEISRVALAGGKRLRPHMVFIGYGAYDSRIALVAAAHEILHISLLIHDDIIDREDTRHNEDTIHKRYNDGYYASIADSSERLHFSTSAALLAGDILISAAHELLARAELTSQQHTLASEILSQGILEVAGGQLLDSEAPFFQDTFDPIIIYRYKTASYSFIAPLLTGVSLSPKNYDTSTLGYVRDFATNLGIAFQIRDDTLGTFGNTATTGKTTTGDLREGKQTLLIALFRNRATNDQLLEFEKYFGNPNATEHQLESLKQSIEQSGALLEATSIETSYKDTAVAALANIADSELRNTLTDFIGYIDGRTA